jgi:hypothetical protein
LGWVIVGTAGVSGYLFLARGALGGRVWPGVALYYAVLLFNLAVAAFIGEWVLVAVGTAIHTVAGAAVWSVSHRPAARLGLENQRA